MRLNDFTIISSTKETPQLSATVPTENLITSGVNGAAAILALDKKSGGFFAGFTTPIGDDNDDNPYANANLYNVATVNTDTELAVTQSFSAKMISSATTDFIFVLERNERGI